MEPFTYTLFPSFFHFVCGQIRVSTPLEFVSFTDRVGQRAFPVIASDIVMHRVYYIKTSTLNVYFFRVIALDKVGIFFSNKILVLFSNFSRQTPEE